MPLVALCHPCLLLTTPHFERWRVRCNTPNLTRARKHPTVCPRWVSLLKICWLFANQGRNKMDWGPGASALYLMGRPIRHWHQQAQVLTGKLRTVLGRKVKLPPGAYMCTKSKLAEFLKSRELQKWSRDVCHLIAATTRSKRVSVACFVYSQCKGSFGPKRSGQKSCTNRYAFSGARARPNAARHPCQLPAASMQSVLHRKRAHARRRPCFKCSSACLFACSSSACLFACTFVICTHVCWLLVGGSGALPSLFPDSLSSRPSVPLLTGTPPAHSRSWPAGPMKVSCGHCSHDDGILLPLMTAVLCAVLNSCLKRCPGQLLMRHP